MSSETAEKIAAIFDLAKQEALALLCGQESLPEGAPHLLKAKDVASRLQTNTQAVYRLAREGKLPHVKLSPRAYRWTEDAVNSFLEAGRNVKVQPEPLRLLQGKG